MQPWPSAQPSCFEARQNSEMSWGNESGEGVVAMVATVLHAFSKNFCMFHISFHFFQFSLQFFDKVNTICSTIAGTATFIVVCWSKGYHKRTWPGWSFKDGQYPPNFFLYLHDVWFSIFDFFFCDTTWYWYKMIDTILCSVFGLLPHMQSNSKNITV